MSEEIGLRDIKRISLEELVKDRNLQLSVCQSLSVLLQMNPYPHFKLGSRIEQYCTFLLDEDRYHIYFFQVGKVEDNGFLREKDKIDSGFGKQFVKPLCRVGILGGLPERYNPQTEKWEEFGEQKYRPGITGIIRNIYFLISSQQCP